MTKLSFFNNARLGPNITLVIVVIAVLLIVGLLYFYKPILPAPDNGKVSDYNELSKNLERVTNNSDLESDEGVSRTAPCRGTVAPACPSPEMADCKDGRWVCVPPAGSGVGQAQGGIAVSDGGATTSATFSGQVLAGTTSPVLDFNKTDYETALKSNRLVLLYFYADWCPICQKEVANALYPAFSDIDGDRVIALRLNYNDSATDGLEKELALRYGVTYQHTKVILRGGQVVLKSGESWNKSRYWQELNNLLSQ